MPLAVATAAAPVLLHVGASMDRALAGLFSIYPARRVADSIPAGAFVLPVLPWWLLGAVAAVCLLFVAVLAAMFPVLHQVYQSAAAVSFCTLKLNATCTSIEYLVTDLRAATLSVSAPLKRLSDSAESLPVVQPFREFMEDPDVRLMRTVAGATGTAASKGLRSRTARMASQISALAAAIAARIEGAETTETDTDDTSR